MQISGDGKDINSDIHIEKPKPKNRIVVGSEDILEAMTVV